MPSITRVAQAASTAALVLCALTVTTLAVRRELTSSASTQQPGPVVQIDSQPDWRAYATQGWRVGPIGGKIAMVVFTDFECPACRMLEERLAITRQHVAEPFVVVYRHFPLKQHPFAEKAAVASECAGAQGRFSVMHDVLFRRQREFGATAWRAIASDAAVPDLDAFDRCMTGADSAAKIRRDYDVAVALHARGTPTVLVDGARFSAVPTQDRLDAFVRAALGR